ncbi:unnamed protein product [Scytosiphon promiscuus]
MPRCDEQIERFAKEGDMCAEELFRLRAFVRQWTIRPGDALAHNSGMPPDVTAEPLLVVHRPAVALRSRLELARSIKSLVGQRSCSIHISLGARQPCGNEMVIFYGWTLIDGFTHGLRTVRVHLPPVAHEEETPLSRPMLACRPYLAKTSGEEQSSLATVMSWERLLSLVFRRFAGVVTSTWLGPSCIEVMGSLVLVLCSRFA